MSNADIRGRFIWHELMTTDPAAAGAFYSKVVSWKTQPSGMPSYTLWLAGKAQVGGLMSLEGVADIAPHWLIYIGTPDVDATVAEAQRLGGRVLKEAADIPNVGRFALLADPQGAAFAVFTPGQPAPQGAAPAPGVGEFAWHELSTTDHVAALSFYSALFGWEKGPGHDMGAMGTYQLVVHEGRQVGGLYNAENRTAAPYWLSYVRVPDAGKATKAAKAAGGHVLHGPTEVPGGSWITVILDPQEAAFAVVEMAQPAAADTGGEAAQSAKAPAARAKKPAAAAQAPESPPAEAPAAAPAAAKPARKAARKAARKGAGGAKASGKAKAAKKTAKKSARKAGGRAAAKGGKKTAVRKKVAKKSPPRKSAAKRSAGKRVAKRAPARKRSAAGKRAKRR